MVWPNRKHPQSVHFQLSPLFSIQFIFQLVFEVSYLLMFFFSPSCQESTFSGGSRSVEYHYHPPPWDERISGGKAGHDLTRMPLKGDLSVFKNTSGGGMSLHLGKYCLGPTWREFI